MGHEGHFKCILSLNKAKNPMYTQYMREIIIWSQIWIWLMAHKFECIFAGNYKKKNLHVTNRWLKQNLVLKGTKLILVKAQNSLKLIVNTFKTLNFDNHWLKVWS